MKTKNIINLKVISIVFLVLMLLMPDILEARGGRGFGGGRSFGGSRRSFSNRQYSRQPSRTSPTQSNRMGTSQRKTSFGGTRLSSSQNYTKKYGTPRRTAPAGTTPGVPKNYVVHQYGGYGNSLMMGYLMGQSSFLWMMPFHPAFYYSKPYYVENPDGTMEVYPPTFSFEKVIITIIILAGIVFIIRAIIKRKRQYNNQQSSQSSFM
ncbi:MAG TPA: hypothetical protein PKY56_01020 [Candidatus Kapabacteria bacterium]|nr:hypothetical protein [Candidatus Kapabacteria bacterium]HPO61767.1 hypothetical protein [Candidatus Kapabacteria bacterium]